MNAPPCPACHSSSDQIFPSAYRSHGLVRGQEIRIVNLISSAASGCQPCSMLLSTLRTFQNLSPDFRMNYIDREVKSLFLARSHTETLFVAFDCSGTFVDHVELYTALGMRRRLHTKQKHPQDVLTSCRVSASLDWLGLCGRDT